MDRSTIIGFILIAAVLMVWIWLNTPPAGDRSPAKVDTHTHDSRREDTISKKQESSPVEQKTAPDSLGKYFKRLSGGKERVYEIRTNLLSAVLTTKGASIKSWKLSKYRTWDGDKVDLINHGPQGDFNLLFYTSDGKLINTKYLDFHPQTAQKQTVDLREADSVTVPFELLVGQSSRIVKAYTFYKDRYSFNVAYLFEGMDSIISNFDYQVVWETGLKYQERNSIDESSSAMAYAFSGGELTELDASKFDEPPVTQNISGKVAWIATRNKYFALAISSGSDESRGAYLEGHRRHMPDNGAEEYYSIGLKMPYHGKEREEARISVFLGPLDFDVVKSQNMELERIMSLGAAWVIRPISEYVMIPLFKFLHFLIPNYGLVIIVFSLIIKVVLYPLTKTSMKSMKKMQALQPMIEEIRAKYKDDPQKMNTQVMRLYKEYGVNPAGGCLPMLLQLPILYALWAVFRSTIELRQAAFVGWIRDLSVPDVITVLPFPLPIFNITEVSGLSLCMGITMFVQQKMSVKDPRQKMMVWLMPVFMTLLFNSFPSGLNLYYFVFNLFSIGQQYWINKAHKDEPLQKVEAKKASGLFSRITKDLPKLK